MCGEQMETGDFFWGENVQLYMFFVWTLKNQKKSVCVFICFFLCWLTFVKKYKNEFLSFLRKVQKKKRKLFLKGFWKRWNKLATIFCTKGFGANFEQSFFLFKKIKMRFVLFWRKPPFFGEKEMLVFSNVVFLRKNKKKFVFFICF